METSKLDSGIRLLTLAGMLQCGKYIAAAVFMSGAASQSRELFMSGLGYMGQRLDIMSAVAALAGLVLVAVYIKESIDNRKGK